MNKSGSIARWIFAIVAIVLAFNMTARLFDIPFYYYDEGVYVDAGQSLWDGHAVENWEHPPLGKYFILAGRLLTKDKVIGARWPAVVASLLCLALLSLTAERAFAGRFARGFSAAAVSALALSDPLFVNLGKMAMLDMYALLFVTAALWLTVSKVAQRSTNSWIWFGLSSGLAMATKWSTAPVFLILSCVWWGRERHALGVLLGLGTAAAIYFAAFLPYKFLLSAPVSWGQIAGLNWEMLSYHRNFVQPLNPSHALWEYLLDGDRRIVATGNAVTYIAGLIGVWLAWQHRRPKVLAAILPFGLLSTVFFWLAISFRQLHAHYFLLCTPFVYLGVVNTAAAVKRPVWSYALLLSAPAAFIFYQRFT